MPTYHVKLILSVRDEIEFEVDADNVEEAEEEARDLDIYDVVETIDRVIIKEVI
ncbi:hypothetical protein SDC9_106502 [bioreactor metagenome]|uniref:Uncharacterized protein n=1 Tax=bioreactor metagenome TaxID=1076179 RepID=A0A645B3K6_9ZZZZ